MANQTPERNLLFSVFQRNGEISIISPKAVMSDCFSVSSATSNTVTYFCKLESWEFCVHSFNTQSRRKGCVNVSQASWSQDTLPPSLDDEPACPARPGWPCSAMLALGDFILKPEYLYSLHSLGGERFYEPSRALSFALSSC